MNKKVLFWIGIGIGIFIVLGASYFVVITEYGANYEVEDRLLGKLIFHNLYVLIAYVLIALFLIAKGFIKFR